MSSFNFKRVQLLDLTSSDQPSIDVRDGQLTITAHRGSDQIMITAPMESLLPAKVNQTTVKAPGASKERKAKIGSINRAPLPADHPIVGENNPLAKMTVEKVKEMRALANDEDYVGSFQSRHSMMEDLGRAYNIHWTTVYNIVTYKSWKHVTD